MSYVESPHASDVPAHDVHPRRSRARVLLSSVFGPYARDDEYGSRSINPMELYHNQVTRVEGPFSLRMFHRSWGLMLIQANLRAPCTLLDFPTRERFEEELRTHRYDIVGISSIIPNLGKVRAMCELVRRLQPQAEIVVGGHIANLPGLSERIDVDHVVRGEGVRWFREHLGEDPDAPIRHPVTESGFAPRAMGLSLGTGPTDVAATLIPSVGCPLGCNFCSTSAMFGGKGRCVQFFDSGDDLFEVMCGLERELGVCSFFVMDENFLLSRSRALRLKERMEEHDKAWSLFLFSSANALRLYSMDELVALGVSWVWMGLEGESSQYTKLRGTDTLALVRELQSHGIRVMGSTIIGLENHTPESMDDVIDHAVRHDADFHQFMLYTPVPGTPLHEQLTAEGRMKGEDEVDLADIHGQKIFNYRHPHIPPGEETELLLRAFRRDFEVNGPSLVRCMRTTLAGWRRHKDHPDPRIRRRFRWEASNLVFSHSAGVTGARRYLRADPALRRRLRSVEREIRREFGWRARLAGWLGGAWVHHTLRREARRLERGWTYEPPTFYEANPAAMAAIRRSEPDAPAASLPRPTRVLPPVARTRTSSGRSRLQPAAAAAD